MIPLTRPSLDREEEEAVTACLRSGWLAAGPRVVDFERAFADYLGCGDAVAVSSGTAALHLALWSLDLKAGDEVVTPSLTWVSAPNLIALLGARPVFCDVDADTLCLDAADLERCLTPRTRAVVPMHFAGRPADLARIYEIAEAHSLVVIEDAAHAVGARLDDRPVGAAGHLCTFSFHPTKNITTGEGGMVTGTRSDLLARIRLRRYHGIVREDYDLHDPMASARHLPSFDVPSPGVKYVMADVNAAIGLRQLAKLDRFNAERERLVAGYREALGGDSSLAWIAPAETRPGARHAWHLFNVRVGDAEGLRDRVAGRLGEAGIQAGLHYRPVHRMAWARGLGGARPLPVTELAGRTILSLPLYPGLADGDLALITDTLRAAL